MRKRKVSKCQTYPPKNEKMFYVFIICFRAFWAFFIFLRNLLRGWDPGRSPPLLGRIPIFHRFFEGFPYSDCRVLSSRITPATLVSVFLDVSGDSNSILGHQMHLATINSQQMHRGLYSYVPGKISSGKILPQNVSREAK